MAEMTEMTVNIHAADLLEPLIQAIREIQGRLNVIERRLDIIEAEGED